MSIGEKLVDLRGGKSIEIVANAIGVSSQAIWNYENNMRIPRDEIKKKISIYYNVPVGELFFSEDSN